MQAPARAHIRRTIAWAEGLSDRVCASVSCAQVIDAVQQGKLKHIFLVGGCDGHEPQRAYYSGLGTNLPKDTLLLTLGCGKFRLLDQDFGTLGDTGLPRLLDMGQCNDAYSALVVATELAKAFKTDVNSLPLSLDISWFEQKAVAVSGLYTRSNAAAHTHMRSCACDDLACSQ